MTVQPSHGEHGFPDASPVDDDRPKVNDDTFEENGRLYMDFCKGRYLCPCDETEKNRLDRYHRMIRLARKRIELNRPCSSGSPELHFAPIPWKEMMPTVLDLGCGTGIWVLDMVSLYHNRTDVVGVDLFNMTPFPSTHEFRKLPRTINYDFQFNKDFEKPWHVDEKLQDPILESWDFIRMSMLCGSVMDWPVLYARILRHLKPGQAYLEQVEIDLRPIYDKPEHQNDPSMPLNRWYSLLTAATRAQGCPIEYDLNTPDILRATGFVDVEEYSVPLALHFDDRWPENTLDRTIAKWYCSCLQVDANERESTFEALSLAAFTRVLKWTFEQWKAFESDIWNSIRNPEVRVYHTLRVIVARKPSIYEINRPPPRRPF